MFEVRVDDIQQAVSPSIKNPHKHYNVKAYAAKDEPIADALIRNLIFIPDPTGSITPNFIDVARGNLIRTLPRWGPRYEISFDVQIEDFSGEVLHLTTGGHCCKVGEYKAFCLCTFFNVCPQICLSIILSSSIYISINLSWKEFT